jgi:hypothetical protein
MTKGLMLVTRDQDHVRYLSDNFVDSFNFRANGSCPNIPDGYILVDVIGKCVDKIFECNVNNLPIYIWFESVFVIPAELAGVVSLFYENHTHTMYDTIGV